MIAKWSYDDSFVAFVKGSPEKIESISLPMSIPKEYHTILQNYTQDGLRVLALSYKYLPHMTLSQAKEVKREDVEKNVIFIGFLGNYMKIIIQTLKIVMQNMVKPATMIWLGQLQKAAIDTIMATGDNGLTAVSVGREWDIINSHKIAYIAELSDNNTDGETIIWTKIDIAKSGIHHTDQKDNQELPDDLNNQREVLKKSSNSSNLSERLAVENCIIQRGNIEIFYT